MSMVMPAHGTSARYHGRTDHPGCRCGPCRARAVRDDAERRLDRLAGRPRTIPADEVRQWLRSLAEHMSHDQIAASARTAQSTVSQLISGQRKSVRSDTADRLMRVRVSDRTETCMVPALGATRRVRALYAMAHGPSSLAAATWLHRDTITGLAAGRWQRVTAARFDAVRHAYDELSMVPGVAREAKEWAQENGWAPPLAWDDDTIDDPTAVPVLDAPEPLPTAAGENAVARWLMGESVVLDRMGRREAIAYLMEWTEESSAEIAARLESTPDAVSRAWERIKKKARQEGRPVPWRRKLELASRDLSKREMEKAA